MYQITLGVFALSLLMPVTAKAKGFKSGLNTNRLGIEVRFMHFTDDHCYFYGPGTSSGRSGKYTWTLNYWPE